MHLALKFIQLAVSLLPILLFTACQSQRELVSGLAEREANEILVILKSQQLKPVKVEVPGRQVTFNVTINENDVFKALRILVDNKLPREKSQGLASVYPVGGGGLIPTASEEKAKYVMALQGEVENMFKILPGVVESRVVIVIPDGDTIRDINSPPPEATASVAIVYNPIDDEGNAAISTEDIKYLVSSAVEGLAPASVTVVLASNTPLKLIDVKKHKQKKTVSKPVYTSASRMTQTPPPTQEVTPGLMLDSPHAAGVVADPKALKKQTEAALKAEEKDYRLLWMFALLAVLGLSLGIFSLIRAIGLKSKFEAMQKNMASGGPEPSDPTQVSHATDMTSSKTGTS